MKGVSRVRGVPSLDGKDAVVSGGNVGGAEDRIGCLMSGRKEADLEKKAQTNLQYDSRPRVEVRRMERISANNTIPDVVNTFQSVKSFFVIVGPILNDEL